MITKRKETGISRCSKTFGSCQNYVLSLELCEVYIIRTNWDTMCVRACVRACVHACVRACVRVCVCVCVCLRPFTVKVSSVWISWNAREQINDVMLKPFFSYAKSLPPFFRMKHQTFLTMHHILFTH